LVFEKNAQLAEIAENFDHNIDPGLTLAYFLIVVGQKADVRNR
jgi:hypothetical protein